MGINTGTELKADTLEVTQEILALVAEIDEFKGAWRALGTLAPERLSALRRVATIESIGSSTRIEGSKLSDAEVEKLLSNLEVKSFESRDEQEIAGYAQVMETIFASFEAIDLTENHIMQLHRDLLQFSAKDERHRGAYKTLANHVSAFDVEGKEVGVIFETATPFDTPQRMLELVEWTRTALRDQTMHPFPWLRHIFADGGYAGEKLRAPKDGDMEPRNHPQVRQGQRFRSPAQTMGCRTHARLARTITPPCQRLGAHSRKRHCLALHRKHPAHDQAHRKTLILWGSL
jgi:hypothetical protein